MSFYGNQYLEFQKFFYELLLRKNGVTEAVIKPEGVFDKLTIEPTDSWIKIEALGDTAGFGFAHATNANEINSENGTHDSHEHENVEKITHEQCLQINDLKFDKAGHIVEVIPKYYEMPNVLRWQNLSE